MKRAVIDIGSNSVRLLIEGNKEKDINTTQLAENLIRAGRLSEEAILRTLSAVKEFADKARQCSVEEILAFATEAVRVASNSSDFIVRIKECCGVEVEILSPEKEALAGYLGASLGGRACIFDIGGASTEITVGKDKDIIYSKSLPIGIVRLRDLFSQDRKLIESYVDSILIEYGVLSEFDYAVGIGGTAATVASIILQGYNYDRVHHYRLKSHEITHVLELIDKSSDLSKIKGLPLMRRSVILGGVILLERIVKMLQVSEIIVSEEDNMEGYLKIRDR